jgi:tellurite resistance protein TerC
VSGIVWVGCAAIVAAALYSESRAFAPHREPSEREAVVWSLGWLALAAIATSVVYALSGPGDAADFSAVYVIERSLSLDNVFLWLLVLGYFQIPDELRATVILWGIAAALVLRAGAILGGVALIDALHAFVYVFGAALLYVAYRVLRGSSADFDPQRAPFVRAIRGLLPLTQEYRGGHLVVRGEGHIEGTPLLLAVSAVVFADIAFAIDSIPAALAVTRDPLVIWAANAFALVGLVAFLALVDDLVRRFRYIDETIGLVLAFVGAKLLLEDVVSIGDLATLAVIIGALVLGIAASLMADRLAPESASAKNARTPPRCPATLTGPPAEHVS